MVLFFIAHTLLDFLWITGNEDQECLWIIKSDKPDSLIELTWDIKFANNDCKSTSNKVEVYDGLPDFISSPTSLTVSLFFRGICKVGQWVQLQPSILRKSELHPSIFIENLKF